MTSKDKIAYEEADEFIASGWRRVFSPRVRLLPSEWIVRHFRHGAHLERFDLERFPWFTEPLDCLADYRVEEQLFIGPPQIGKSLAAEGSICYFIVEDPGDLVAYTHTIPLAKSWAETRVIPSIKRCEPCRPYLPSDQKKIRTTEILMNHMIVEVEADNESSTQFRSRRIVECDERWLWEGGRYDNAKRRASSPNFDGRRKIISWSNSGIWESDVEAQWRQSDQRVLHAACPKCGGKFPFKFSEKKCRRVSPSIPGFTIEWDENHLTRPNGTWDIDEVVKTVRLVCPGCKERFEDGPRIRVQLRRTMHYVALNPRASTKARAWAISGVAVYPWGDLVKQFLYANAQLDLGDDKEMREFMLKGLNEAWSEEVLLDTTTNSTGDYAVTAQPWDQSDFPAMTVDVQKWSPHFWFVIRDWRSTGPSRQRLCGNAQTWDELRALQQTHKVSDRYVHVDSGFDPSEVYEHCARWAWIALRGTDEDYFIHSKGLKVPIRRYFSEPRAVDPAIGTELQGGRSRALEFFWGNKPVKDILARLYTGRGVYFGVPSDVPQYYMDQMASETLKVVMTRGTQEVRRWVKIGKRPNHLWDCEAMQVVFALIKGPLRAIAAPPPGPDADATAGAGPATGEKSES